MNFDLGAGLVAEFERRFGRTLTTVVLFLVLMAIVVLCVGIVWGGAVKPIYGLIGEVLPNITLPAQGILTAFYATAVALVAVFLGAVFQYFARHRRVPQSVVNKLARCRKTANDELLNGRVTDEQEFRAWETKQSQWREDVTKLLTQHFPEAEVLGFQSIGVIQSVAFPHAFNNEHNFKLGKLAKRLSILEDIIRRYTR